MDFRDVALWLDVDRSTLRTPMFRAFLGFLMVATLLVLGVWLVKTIHGPDKAPARAVEAETKAAVVITQTEEAEAVESLQAEVAASITETSKRTEKHVAAVRRVAREQAASAPALVPYPDEPFFVGLCASRLYRADPACKRYGGEPEGGRTIAGAGELPASPDAAASVA